MKSVVAFISLVLLGCGVIGAQSRSGKVGIGERSADTRQLKGASMSPAAQNQINAAVEKGAKWLASVQGADGGWGQDGGASSHNRQSESLESKGNDVANTAMAALALLRAGNQYRPNIERAIAFVLQKIEASPADGLSITDVKPTQIQRKLGPYIDTFLASMLLAQVEGTYAGASKARVRSGLEKCVAKIERNQMSDGSWNIGGGWAPILGTSLASRSLYEASKNGVKVDREVMARADAYTLNSQKGGSSSGPGSGGGTGSTTESVTVDGVARPGLPAADAGIVLYKDAQALEQLSRTEADRKKNASEIATINRKLSDTRFVEGYGSIGGEEFFSYLNISDSLKRTGGKEWEEWNTKITQKILKLQNNDGTWAGHHCITGRVAVTSAAILNLTPNYEN
jgi:hypothetical protein